LAAAANLGTTQVAGLVTPSPPVLHSSSPRLGFIPEAQGGPAARWASRPGVFQTLDASRPGGTLDVASGRIRAVTPSDRETHARGRGLTSPPRVPFIRSP